MVPGKQLHVLFVTCCYYIWIIQAEVVGSFDIGAPGTIREVDIHLVSQLKGGMVPEEKYFN